MFTKILVPLDGSDTAEAVLQYVREIASRTKAEVVLVTAVQQVGVWDATLTLQVLDKEEELALEYLQSKVAELAAAGGVNVRARVTRGDAAEAILTVADDEKASL